MKASVLFVVALAVGCGGPKGPGGGGGGGAHDAYDSYPQLALIPADSPYAFVSFKRMSPAMARRMYALFQPKGHDDDAEPPSAEVAKKTEALRKAFRDVAGSGLTPQKLVQLGMLEAPRFSVYGVEGYPVFRLEIGDGAKMLAVLEDVAARAGLTMPPTVQRGDHTYWSFPIPKLELMLSVAPREIVLAFAPPAVMARTRDVILGVAQPAASISPSVFRELASTHGFGGHGLGFVDTAKMIHAFGPPAVTTGACGGAIDELATAFPRFVLGLDVGETHLGYRAIIELSAPVREALAGLETSIPKVAPAGDTPLLTATAAFDVDRARALLPRVADVLSDLSARCRIPDLGAELDELASTAWPPFLRGIQGASVVITAMDEAAGTMAGSAVLHVADPPQLLSTLSSTLGMPGLHVQPNGKAVEVLRGILPYSIHLAMTGRSLALGIGPDSDLAAEAALGGAVEPAPLVRMTFDYTKFGDLPIGRAEAMASALSMFGEGTLEVSIGDRGLVSTFTVELQ